MKTVGELLPDFCKELQGSLITIGCPDLVDQLPSCSIVARCECGEPNCAHFYTEPPPDRHYANGHSNLVLNVAAGFVAFDLVDDRIVAVEVLDRPDVKVWLDQALPVAHERPASDLPCPACGFLTVPEPGYGSYSICPICDWEDDAVQLANPACGGGANHLSLVEAQAGLLARLPETIRETKGVARSPMWRPLRPKEIETALAERDAKYWMHEAAMRWRDCYWNRSGD